MKRPILNALRRFLFGFPEGSLESWIASEDLAENALADETLRHMGEEKTLIYLLATIEKEEKRRRGRGWRNATLIWVGSLFAMFLVAFTGFRQHIVLMTVQDTSLYFAFITVLVGGVPSRLHQWCVERLAALDDRRTFLTLVAELVNPYKIAGDAVARRLTRMLPTLEATDFAALSKDHQRRFFLYINPEFSHRKANDKLARQELARAILLAVTRLGNGDAISETKKLANAKPKTGENNTLQRTAQNCLPLLEKTHAERKANMEATEEQKVVVGR